MFPRREVRITQFAIFLTVGTALMRTVPSTRIPKSNNSNKRLNRRQRPSQVLGSRVFTPIHEKYTIATVTTGAGALSASTSISPAGCILAARLAGYQAISDEIRLDRVLITMRPIFGTNYSGAVAVYIDRDAAAATVASELLACDQREQCNGQLFTEKRLEWRPQEPADKEFNLINPGTVALAKFHFVGVALTDSAGAAIANGANLYTSVIEVWATLRGRP